MIAIPLTAATACGLSIGNKVVYEIIKNKYNKYKKQNEKDQNTIKCFDKLYRNPLQDNVSDKVEYESLCNIFTKCVNETKKSIFFINMNIKIKLYSFSPNKLKFQTRI